MVRPGGEREREREIERARARAGEALGAHSAPVTPHFAVTRARITTIRIFITGSLKGHESSTAQETRICVFWDQPRMFIISVVQTPRIHLAAVQTATVSAAQRNERWPSAKAANTVT